MGLFGSVHCVMMCGPLIAAIPNVKSNYRKQLWIKLNYHAGRIITYGVLGFSIAYLGSLSNFVKNGQQVISLITGGGLIVLGLLHWLPVYTLKVYKKQQHLLQPIFKQIGYWLFKPGGHFVAGLLNGLLPCGMIYIALASALNAESPMGGAMFMLLFGAGTLPLLFGFTLVASWGKGKIKLNFNKWLPVLFVLMGLWFLLRGANLDIPILSPVIYPEGALNCK